MIQFNAPQETWVSLGHFGAVHSLQISIHKCILELRLDRMFKVSMCCQKLAGTQWRYWFSVDKHFSGTCRATLPRISSVCLGSKRNDNGGQLMWILMLPVHFCCFCSLFLKCRKKTIATDSQPDISQLTTDQVTVYTLQSIANVTK